MPRAAAPPDLRGANPTPLSSRGLPSRRPLACPGDRPGVAVQRGVLRDGVGGVRAREEESKLVVRANG